MVLDRVVGHGILSDYATKEGAIPLPATFSMELSERISKQNTGLQARLYSDFPFPWRKEGGPRNDFESEAIHQLRQFPDQPFTVLKIFRVANHYDMPWPIAWRLVVSPVTTVILTAPRPTGNWETSAGF